MTKFPSSKNPFSLKTVAKHKWMSQLCRNLGITPFIVLKIHEITILTLVAAPSNRKAFLWLQKIYGNLWLWLLQHDHRKRFSSSLRNDKMLKDQLRLVLMLNYHVSGLHNFSEIFHHVFVSKIFFCKFLITQLESAIN